MVFKIIVCKKWIEFTRVDIRDPNAKKGMGAIMLTSFVITFITCLGIAVLRSRLDINGWMSGVKLGLVTGVCFGAAAINISYLYEKKPLGLHLINCGYTIGGNIVAAIVICSWT